MAQFWKAILYILLLALLAHPVGQALPRSWGRPETLPAVRKWEKRLYVKLGIRSWKKFLPDMSRFLSDMVPKQISEQPKSDDIHRLVQETCIAEQVHWALCVLSVGIVLIDRQWHGALLLLAYVLLFNLPYIMIQRYNRPKLLALERQLRRKEEASDESVDPDLQYRRGT